MSSSSDRRRGSTRVSLHIFLALLALNFVLRCALALRPLRDLDGPVLRDDTYLDASLARNLAAGLGPLYGASYTNGFQPLFVLLVAPFYRVWHDPFTPIRASLLVLAVFDTLTLALLVRGISRWARSPATPLLVGLAWCVNPFVIATSENGLETALSLFGVVVTLDYAARTIWAREGDDISSWTALGLGALIGVATFARVDNVFLAPAIALPALARRPRARRSAPKLAAVGLLGFALTYGPWLLYSRVRIGGFIPVSGAAVRELAYIDAQIAWPNDPDWLRWYARNLFNAITAVISSPRNRLFMITVAAFRLIATRAKKNAASEARDTEGWLPSASIFGVALVAFYGLYVGADWYMDRYTYPLVLMLLLLLACDIDTVLERSSRPHRWTLAVAAIQVFATLAAPYLRRLYTWRNTGDAGYANVAFWTRDRFPPGTSIGALQSGAIAYFAPELRVTNLDGVVNEHAHAAMLEGRLMSYVREQRIEYVVDWKAGFLVLRFASRSSSDPEFDTFEPVPRFTESGIPWIVGHVSGARPS